MDIRSMERWNNLTSTEMDVLKEMQARIEAGGDKVLIRDVASAAYTSPASVVRLAKKLGYSGYSALLYAMRADLEARRTKGDAGTCERALATQESMMAVESLAVDLALGRAKRVHVLGAGYSAYVAGYFSQRLQEQGLFATEKSPLDFADDVPIMVIYVSESGETHDLTFIQERCALRGFDDFVFSADAESTLCTRSRRFAVVEKTDCQGDRNPHFFVVNCLMVIESVMARMRVLIEDSREGNQSLTYYSSVRRAPPRRACARRSRKRPQARGSSSPPRPFRSP